MVHGNIRVPFLMVSKFQYVVVPTAHPLVVPCDYKRCSASLAYQVKWMWLGCHTHTGPDSQHLRWSLPDTMLTNHMCYGLFSRL